MSARRPLAGRIFSNMNNTNYQKISRASELSGSDRLLYRALEIFPGFLSWLTLIGLFFLSIISPFFAAIFIIIFDIYWLLLVVYLIIHLLAAYKKMRAHLEQDWEKKLQDLPAAARVLPFSWTEIIQVIIFPTYQEGLEVIRPSFRALLQSGWPAEKLIVVLATEKRAGPEAQVRAETIRQEFGHCFRAFLVTIHPDNIPGEIKGKGSNQAWAARKLRDKIIEPAHFDPKKILVNIFDIDSIIFPGYFHCLAYHFLTAEKPYRSSYQPIPIYHNNIWQAPFFSRVSAYSNSFWQMMQQIRCEKLATYSSHALTWTALLEIDFWAPNMVSEDSRIFWHLFLHYRGDYRVIPLHFPISMDATMDKSFWQSAKNLYRQQRRWGWGVENIPYLMFNMIKNWQFLPKKLFINRLLVQLHGFHSWATNALIIGLFGWLPIFFGGDEFRASILSANLPVTTRLLMSLAMVGLIISAIISALLLPRPPKKFFFQKITIFFQWLILPFNIIIFGSIPGLEAQTRLMFGKYLGFWVTPKNR